MKKITLTRLQAIRSVIFLSLCVAQYIISAPTAHAASFGDDYYVKTNTISVNSTWTDNGSGIVYSCGNVDMTTSYMSVLANAAAHSTTVNGYYQSLLAAQSNSGVWGVSMQEQARGSGQYADNVIVAWSEDPNTVPVQFISTSGVIATPLTNTNNAWKMLTIQGSSGNQNNNMCNDQVVFGETLGANQWAIFSTSPTAFTSNGSFMWAKNYFINAPVDYPSGYAGATIKDTGAVLLSNNALTPAWRYSISNKDITVQSIMTDAQIDQFHITTCLFQIPNNTYGDNYDESVYDCKSRPAINHTFADLGTYNVINRVQTSDGQWFDSARTLTIDGSSSNGIIGGSDASNTILGALSGISTNSHGLSNIIMAPLSFIAELPGMINSCAPLNLPFGNIGTMTLPCMTPVYQTNFGTLFALWQTVLIGLFSYRMGVSLFEKIKNISSPNDDRIEVVNL